jgi:hypothetical protein
LIIDNFFYLCEEFVLQLKTLCYEKVLAIIAIRGIVDGLQLQ